MLLDGPSGSKQLLLAIFVGKEQTKQLDFTGDEQFKCEQNIVLWEGKREWSAGIPAGI